MSNEGKSIHIIEVSNKEADWESWSEKFLLHGKGRGYKKLLVSSRSMSGMVKIPTEDEYKNAMEGNADHKKRS